jgi:hypothetical protein
MFIWHSEFNQLLDNQPSYAQIRCGFPIRPGFGTLIIKKSSASQLGVAKTKCLIPTGFGLFFTSASGMCYYRRKSSDHGLIYDVTLEGIKQFYSHYQLLAVSSTAYYFAALLLEHLDCQQNVSSFLA